ncbi:adenosine deaminase [Aspergillus sp. HF37]|nr:adenosine deaminase [Aspergillus sp. HF37]
MQQEGSGESKHVDFMQQALQMGEAALQTGETPVGCVLVYEGQIVGRGMNDTNRSMNGTKHAEFIAIDEMLRSHPRSALRSTDLYVTVEPCVMCASALRQYRIRAVYFGCGNERFGGTGSILTMHSDFSVDPPYPVHGGLFREDAIMLLRRFYLQENSKAPKPRPKRNRELKTEVDNKAIKLEETP